MLIKTMIQLLGLLLIGIMAGCATKPSQPAASPQPPITSESPSGLPPVNKAKNAAKDAQQKALEREQTNLETQQEPTPDAAH